MRSVTTASPEKDRIVMGNFTKFIAWGGFVAALGLCIFDFVTSVMGLRIILGRHDDRPIAFFMPMIFAMLALCFNGLSAYMFRMYMQEKFTRFAPIVTGIMWVFFVTYDAVSAFVGMLDQYATTPVDSWQGIIRAMDHLGAAGGFFVVVMAALLAFGPFLCCMFYQLALSGRMGNDTN